MTMSDQDQPVTRREFRLFKWESRGLYIVAVGLAFVMGLLVVRLDKVDREQRDGRKVGLGVTCGVLSGVTEAGRRTIEAGAMPATTPQGLRFDRNLQRLGYPPVAARQAAASAAADHYVQLIVREVEQTSGVKGLVITKGSQRGKLDCKKLGRVAAVNP